MIKKLNKMMVETFFKVHLKSTSSAFFFFLLLFDACSGTRMVLAKLPDGQTFDLDRNEAWAAAIHGQVVCPPQLNTTVTDAGQSLNHRGH